MNANRSKPSAFGIDFSIGTGPTKAAYILHELRGWELFEAAIFRQMEPPPLPKKALLPNYPDAGRIGADAPKK